MEGSLCVQAVPVKATNSGLIQGSFLTHTLVTPHCHAQTHPHNCVHLSCHREYSQANITQRPPSSETNGPLISGRPGVTEDSWDQTTVRENIPETRIYYSEKQVSLQSFNTETHFKGYGRSVMVFSTLFQSFNDI